MVMIQADDRRLMTPSQIAIRALHRTATGAPSRFFHQSSMAGASVRNATEIEVPPGFRLYTENTSHILLSSDEAFLNPVQEFNRDLSVASIRVWSEELNRMKEEKWRTAQSKKKSGQSQDFIIIPALSNGFMV
jgi:hypothetical protein